MLNAEKSTIPDLLIGSGVASVEFVRGMAGFLPAQTMSLFVPDGGMASAKRELARLAENEEGNFGSVQVLGLHQIPNALGGNSDWIFHNSRAPQLHQLSYLRSAFSQRPFPITCLTHGISLQSLLSEVFTRLHLTPLLPCDSVVCTSQATKQAFLSILNRIQSEMRQDKVTPNVEPRLDVIPLGVDTDLFRPRDKADMRRLLGLPRKKTLLLYFGRIDHRAKGDPAPLLMAFSSLVRKYGDTVTLVLAGAASPAEVESVRRIAANLGCGDQIIVRPSPPVIETPLYYAAAGVFVSLSDTLQESFGIAPLEAMATGLPVVVSDWSGYRETVLPNQTGFHVRTFWADCNQDVSLFAPLLRWPLDHYYLSQTVAVDVAQLTHYLDALTSSTELRQGMGDAARGHMLDRFSWQRVIGQYQNLWQELTQIAKKQQPQKPRALPLQQPQYFQDFSHFATQILGGLESVDITERGRHISTQPKALPLYDDLQQSLSPHTLLIILRVVSKARLFKYAITVDGICIRVGGKRQTPPQVILAHVMWLLKYDLLQVG